MQDNNEELVDVMNISIKMNKELELGVSVSGREQIINKINIAELLDTVSKEVLDTYIMPAMKEHYLNYATRANGKIEN